MSDAIGAFAKDDHLVLRLLTQLAHPALPAGGCAFHYLLCALPRVCSSQGKYVQGEYDVHRRVFKAGKISVQLLLQGLHDLVPSASPGPPPSAECLSATMKSGPQIKASGNGGTLGNYKEGGEQ
jgi:hypothetical protein